MPRVIRWQHTCCCVTWSTAAACHTNCTATHLAPISMPDPITRSMYCLAGPDGRYLADTTPDGELLYSTLPTDALGSSCCWLASAAAVDCARQLMAQRPGLRLGIALLELQATSPGNWQVVSTRTYAAATSTEKLIA